MDKPIFKLIMLPEADAFLESLAPAVLRKVLFAFWDKDGETLVVATHGLVKKTQKTPKSEIKHAQAIRKEYLETKDK